MLYDNAQLARAYLHAWQLTGDPEYRRVCEETLDYILRDMTDTAGGFHSTEDADSLNDDGALEEGAFYVWTPGEVREALAVLGAPAAEAVLTAYGVTDGGNFEGRNVLHATGEALTVDQAAALAPSRATLRAAREGRPRPARDDKVLVSWNGLMMAALAEAGAALNRPDYTAAAERNATFLLTSLRAEDGRLLHTWRLNRARHQAYLEDYAALCEGLLALYHATFAERWVVAAMGLADTMLTRYRGQQGEFYDTADDHETLLVRPRDLQDNAVPSGGSLAVTALARLAALTSEQRYRLAAEKALASVGDLPGRYPQGFGQWLWAAELMVEPPEEVVVIGAADHPETKAMVAAAREGLKPGRIVARAKPGAISALPLFAGRDAPATRPTAWVCRGATCLAPVTAAEELRRILRNR
jgi:hypothetical protein